MHFFRNILLLLCLTHSCGTAIAEEMDFTPVKRWIAQQSEIRTISADFTQTRSLKTVRKPLVTPGHIWFKSPQHLRWELGDPPKTLVIRKGNEILIITPAEKKVKRMLASEMSGPESQIFGMMDFTNIRSLEEFQRQFEILSVKPSGDQCELELKSKSPSAKFLSKLRLRFSTSSGVVLTLEMNFKDGSFMRNDFNNVRVNGSVEEGKFSQDLAGYEVVNAKE